MGKEKSSTPISARRRAVGSVTLEEVRAKWDELLRTIKHHNQSVASALKIGEPKGIAENGDVVIAFQHRFHRERINELRIKMLVEQVLSELLGKPLFIQTALDASISVSSTVITSAEPDDLQSIVKNFGGQLLD